MKIETNMYKCDLCGTGFNWDSNSTWYGTLKEVDDGNMPAVFCCEGHAETWVRENAFGL